MVLVVLALLLIGAALAPESSMWNALVLAEAVQADPVFASAATFVKASTTIVVADQLGGVNPLQVCLKESGVVHHKYSKCGNKPEKSAKMML